MLNRIYYILLLSSCFFSASSLANKLAILDITQVKDSIQIKPFTQYQRFADNVPFATVRAKKQDWQTELKPLTNDNQAVWMKLALTNSATDTTNIVLLVENNTQTALYLDNAALPKIAYVVESMWVLDGIKYFYQISIPPSHISEVHIKLVPERSVLSKMGFGYINPLNPKIKCYQADFFDVYRAKVKATGDAARLFSFLIIGGLGVVSLMSLLIAAYWRRPLFVYYVVYGIAAFLLLVIKETCYFVCSAATVFQPYLNTFSRSSEFLQIVSLSAYAMFIAELLDVRKMYPRFYKVLWILALLMLLQGFVEVGWLLLTSDIMGYENLIAWSSVVLFPVFFGVIIWMSFFIRHHLIKYVIASNIIFVGILFLGFLRLRIFSKLGIPAYLDSLFSLPFATLLEMVVFSFAIAAKISYDNNLRITSEKRLYQTEMMALRSQINPHFIFNSLNTIRNFILQDDNANASKYLAKFAKLLREILNFSRSNVITLTQELETVRLYLELESARFERDFHYEINVPASLDTDAVPIPPLLLQPYVENAIWHGLRHSDNTEKRLTITLVEESNTLIISILDNGIGREKAARLKSQTKGSLGTQITQERIELFNGNEESALRVETQDALPSGTEVILTYRLYQGTDG